MTKKKGENEPKEKIGRRDKYTDEFPVLVRMYAEQGLTDANIAYKLGIALSTFYDYQKKHPEFSEALREGKVVTDGEIEESLRMRAKGFEFTEVKTEKRNGKVVSVTETTKFFPPDVPAIKMWLGNRNPDEWRDTQKFDLTSGGQPLQITEIAIKHVKE
jgi:transposase-like protein